MEIPHFCAASSTDIYSIKTSFAQYYITLRATYQGQLDIKKGCITFVSYHRFLQNAVVTTAIQPPRNPLLHSPLSRMRGTISGMSCSKRETSRRRCDRHVSRHGRSSFSLSLEPVDEIKKDDDGNTNADFNPCSFFTIHCLSPLGRSHYRKRLLRNDLFSVRIALKI